MPGKLASRPRRPIHGVLLGLTACLLLAAERPERREAVAGEEKRPFWSFRPLSRPAIPAVRHREWVREPIDAFILRKLEARGLRPGPSATRRELLRRLSFDLTGLPPSPAEMERFLADTSPDAWQRAIDRFLASPRHGERWGRHWLDLVRYAQTNGYERDDEKPYAWRYRDYVIRALNADRPYDRFVLEQLAGDELDAVSEESIIATGYYRLGVWDDEPDDRRMAEFDGLDDIVSTTGSTFLGLTINCARCHEHKFDPIPQEDYYSLLAFFRNVRHYGREPEAIFTPLASPGELAAWRADRDKKIDARRRELEALEGKVKAGALTDAELKKRRGALQKEIQKLEKARPPFPVALSVREHGDRAPATHVLVRGNAATPGKEVDPAFPRALAASPPDLPATSPGARTTGRRRILAEWIASPENPLTARVMANRLWHHHFGRGIVPTPSDFGHTGLPPTHPELLDWLASELIRGGWSLKRLHRTILNSSAYRLSSRARPEAQAADPGNELLWRFNLRRLEAEAIRDAVLAVNGRLNLAMEGPGMYPALPKEVLASESRPGRGWGKSSVQERSRRSVYTFIKRTLMVPMLESFDYTNTGLPMPARTTTTIAPQALILLNSDFMEEQSRNLADALLAEAPGSVREQVIGAYRRALTRLPTREELDIGVTYIERQVAAGEREGVDEREIRRQALAAFCKVIYNLNEFVYVD